ncbi:MAG: helix-turn-helix transcriptional regulator [Clostridia bacterium]
MNFNERLIDLRKSKSLTQDELGEKLGVSRQTISKWELAQSYPDFQRLVLLSDYFGLTLDELVKGVNVQDVRDKNLNEEKLSSIYNDVDNAKKTFMSIFNGLAIFGGIAIAILIIFILMGMFL